MPHHVNWTERAQALKADGRAVIDGQRVAAVDGQTFAKHSPVDGRFLTDVSKAWPEEHKKNATAALRRSGSPEEIVTAALYLASPRSSFTTGSLVRVDGGIS